MYTTTIYLISFQKMNLPIIMSVLCTLIRKAIVAIAIQLIRLDSLFSLYGTSQTKVLIGFSLLNTVV